jgi:hypothetical protein
MVTISISAESYRAITGSDPEPSQHDAQGDYALLLDHKTLERLTVMRGPRESYGDDHSPGEE